jgi:hypothetical protein
MIKKVFAYYLWFRQTPIKFGLPTFSQLGVSILGTLLLVGWGIYITKKIAFLILAWKKVCFKKSIEANLEISLT